MRIAIIGTGYVGLVTGVCFAKIGNTVVCIDNNSSKIKTLQSGVPTIYEDGLDELLKENISENRISFTDNLGSVVNSVDLIFIAVGTPSKGETGETDLSYILSATKSIAEEINHDAYVVLKSTAPVGTVDKMKECFYATTKSLNKDINIFVSSNPEFLKEGSAIQDFMCPDRIVIGADDEESKNRLSELYNIFDEQEGVPILCTDVASAQLIKYASNAFNACKISFINSLSRYCAKIGANIADVADGMGLDNRIGRAFLNAGIGYGGSCFPKDVASLKHEITKICSHDDFIYKADLLSSISEENFKAWWWVIELIQTLINTAKLIKDPKIAILGLAFKPNTDDVRYSPALDIIAELSNYYNIKTYDPIATENAKKALFARSENEKDFIEFNNITFCNSLYDAVTDTDVVVLCTEWDEIKNTCRNESEKISNLMRGNIFIDGRNALNRERASQIFDYYCVGKPHISKE